MLGIISSISVFLLASIHFMTTNHVKICHTFPGRKDGRAEMAAAEAEAFSSGEPILHVSRDVFKRSLTLEMGSLEVFIGK